VLELDMAFTRAENVCVIAPVEQLRHMIHRMPLQQYRHRMLVRITLLVDTIVN
jgi:hypothetical protein